MIYGLSAILGQLSWPTLILFSYSPSSRTSFINPLPLLIFKIFWKDVLAPKNGSKLTITLWPVILGMRFQVSSFQDGPGVTPDGAPSSMPYLAALQTSCPYFLVPAFHHSGFITNAGSRLGAGLGVTVPEN